MQRLLVARGGNLEVTFDPDGTGLAPNDATVTVTRADGTLVLSDAATQVSGSQLLCPLEPTDVPVLDELTAVWVSPTRGTATSVAEVVGGVMFTIPELRRLEPLSDEVVYPTSALLEARVEVERAFEEEAGVSFVPRYTRERVVGKGGAAVRLSRSRVTQIREVLVDDVTLTDPQIAALYITGPLLARGRGRRWPMGALITVGYEHGYTVPPGRGPLAAKLLARRRVVGALVDERIRQITSDDGSAQFLVAGQDGPFDIPEANAFLASSGVRTLVA